MTPSVTPTSLDIITKALPEGVELVAFNVAKPDDYEIVNELQGDSSQVKRIYKGVRPGASSGLIVKPADGYFFRYNIKTLAYDVVKTIPPLEITGSYKFTVTNTFDQETVQQAIERLKTLPGYAAQ